MFSKCETEVKVDEIDVWSINIKTHFYKILKMSEFYWNSNVQISSSSRAYNINTKTIL